MGIWSNLYQYYGNTSIRTISIGEWWLRYYICFKIYGHHVITILHDFMLSKYEIGLPPQLVVCYSLHCNCVSLKHFIVFLLNFAIEFEYWENKVYSFRYFISMEKEY